MNELIDLWCINGCLQALVNQRKKMLNRVSCKDLCVLNRPRRKQKLIRLSALVPLKTVPRMSTLFEWLSGSRELF